MFSQVKQSLAKLSVKNCWTIANPLSRLMLINCTLTPCVNRCRPVFIPVGTLIQKPTDSWLIRTRPVALKIWSCVNFKKENQILKSKASMQEADRGKFIASVSMDFVPITTLCSEQWLAFITFVPVKTYVFLSLRKILNAVARKEGLMLQTRIHTGKNFTVIETWECEWWRL